ncbi:hypothetical protein DV589_24845 [Salmonella enterica]|nr:hypothetical protein [Salmonella enterica]
MLACEKLAEIHVVQETVRSLVIKADLWLPANNEYCIFCFFSSDVPGYCFPQSREKFRMAQN